MFTSESLSVTSPQPVDRCAWYLRVSTPKQKLEHQREHVIRFCEQRNIHVAETFQFEDKEKRHKSDKRQDFQRLLEAVKARQLDWILICSFDRWGVADVDEFFEFRRLLLKNDVQLWSVVDSMNLTGLTEGDYFRIVAMAIGATKYVESMAEKNILKMIEMAKQGWAATGNAPFGTDLVCYPLNDLTRPLFRVIRTRYMRPHRFRILHYTADSRVTRDENSLIISHKLCVAQEEESLRMPPRDKKGTGYRFEPSVETDRHRAMNLMFELYDAGMGFREISRSLSDQGYVHYDKPFGYHGIETILSNPAALGRPAWGKNGVGTYRILHAGEPTRIKRKSSDTIVIRKDEAHFIYPLKPLFVPIVAPELWKRVNDRLKARARTNPQFGKRRTRSRTIHPLNGKLFCPDCDKPMVLGSSMPAQGGRGKKTRCFNCGTYRRFARLQCYANTVGWDRLDVAIEQLLNTVKGRIDRLIADPAKTLREEEWARECELTKLFMSLGDELLAGALSGKVDSASFLAPPSAPERPLLDSVFEMYNRLHATKTQELTRERTNIDRDLERIGKLLLEGIPSQTVKKQIFDRMAELEARKREVEPLLDLKTVKAEALIGQLKAIRRTIEDTDRLSLSRLFDTFIERAVPEFEVLIVGKGQRRAILRAVRFIPKKSAAANNILPHAMEFGVNRTGTGSSRRS